MEIITNINDLQNDLLIWFSNQGRIGIPWKLKEDGSRPITGEMLSPYGIWIAEVMLQQTQLKVVLRYWKKWMITFPDLLALAEAEEQEVLLLWQGLGYYSRAKRLHKSSKLLVNLIGKNNILDFSFWPVELDQWMALPGIGKSTAGSIISSAFDLSFPILDGNVRRILSRLIASNKSSLQDTKRLWSLSEQLVPNHNPRDFNQALMDLGAIVCTANKPKCNVCPIQNYCLAFLKYDPIDFPKKNLKKEIPFQEIGLALVFNKDGEILIDQRLDSASMGGMWEFPGGKKESNEPIEKAITREIKEEIGIDIKLVEKLLSFEHTYSHKKLFFTVYICDLFSGKPRALACQKILWVKPNRLFEFPFPAANTKIIFALFKHLGIEKENL